jgi:hypothetical protein
MTTQPLVPFPHPDIDMPRNALLLTQELHSRFGSLGAWFEPVEGMEYTYRYTYMYTFLLTHRRLIPSVPISFVNHEYQSVISALLDPKLLAICFLRVCVFDIVVFWIASQCFFG